MATDSIKENLDALAATYDHPDSVTRTEEIEVANAPEANPEAPASTAPKSTPPRGDDGKFVKAAEHPAYLVQLAKQAGMTDADMASVTTEALGMAVMLAGTQRRVDQSNRDIQERQRGPESKNPEPVAPVKVDETYGIDDDFSDEFTVKLLRGMQKKIADLEKRVAKVDEIESHIQRQAATQHYNELDTEFNKNPDRYGVGSHGKMSEGAHLRRRQLIVDEMKRLSPSTQANSIAELYREAEEVIFGATQAAPAKPAAAPAPVVDSDEVAQRKRDYTEGIVAEPTHRNSSPEPKGREAAIRALDAELRQKNHATRNGKSGTIDGGPP